MNKETNSVVGNVKNTIYSIVFQLVYIPFVTNMSNVFVTIFAGKGQKIAPKTNLPGLKPGAIHSPQVETRGYKYSTPTELVHATLFFCIQAVVGVCLPPIYCWSLTTPIILSLFFEYTL